MKKLSFCYKGIDYISKTKHGEMTLCGRVINQIFPFISGRNFTLLVSNRCQEGFIEVQIQRMNYWEWQIPQHPSLLAAPSDRNLRFFAHLEDVTTSFLKALKHSREDKLPKICRVWIRVEQSE